MSSEIPKYIIQLIDSATKHAISTGSDSITVDHIVLGVLDAPVFVELFTNCGVDAEVLTKSMRKLLSDSSPFTPDEIEARVAAGRLILQPTETTARLIMLTSANATNRDRPAGDIDGLDILETLFEMKPNCAFGNIISSDQKMYKSLIDGIEEVIERRNNKTQQKKSSVGDESEVDDALICVSTQAKRGELDPVIGREKEIHLMCEILSKKKKNNIMMLGDAGVGKTALVEGVAIAINNKTTHKSLHDKVVYSLDIGSLTAGTKFRGEFEKRAINIVNYITKNPNAILFIDEIHTVMGAGGTGNSSGTDLANILKPHLARGKLRCIGATTNEEYKATVQKDKAMVRRFSNITIAEPNREDTLKILSGMVGTFADHHNVKFSNEILEVIYDTSKKYIQNRANPDKAVDILDSAGAYARINDMKEVTEEVVFEMVSRASNVPVAAMVASRADTNYIRLPDNIKEKLYGQDHIVDMVCEQISLSKAGLLEGNKPIASFLLSGTSGVGKTEFARQVAAQLGIPLLKYDMSEYQEAHAVSKLIGAPQGYVGYDDYNGGLVDEIEKNPHCVLLIDEIEKAHVKVLDLFLQVLDDATLKSSHGKMIKFNNVIVLMTSNLGARAAATPAIGFGGSTQEDADINAARLKSEVTDAVKKHFRPEFVNRLDGVASFNNLTKEDVARIVDKELTALREMVTAKGITLNISSSVKELIAKEGFDPKYGARPIKRTITDRLKKPLSRKLLTDLKEGDVINATMKDDEVIFVS